MIDRVFRRLGGLLCVLLMTVWSSALQADYADEWGPPVGTALPMLDALDQDGNQRTFENLAGEEGLLLFFSRSTDW